MKRVFYLLPVAGFVVLAFFLFRSLFSPPPDVLPSVLINQPAPDIGLAAMDAQTPAFGHADLAAGHVTVINFFASWCVPCRLESAQLLRLAGMPGIALYGVDYKDKPSAGRDFLNQLGNPFSRIVADNEGKAGINWGVYGVPETYVVDAKGMIRFKLIGALTADALTGQLLPAIQQAEQNS